MAICFYLNFKNLLIGKGKIQNLIGFAPKYRMEYSYSSLRKLLHNLTFVHNFLLVHLVQNE